MEIVLTMGLLPVNDLELQTAIALPGTKGTCGSIYRERRSNTREPFTTSSDREEIMKAQECIAIVTGGASGLGEACIRNLAGDGGKANHRK